MNGDLPGGTIPVGLFDAIDEIIVVCRHANEGAAGGCEAFVVEATNAAAMRLAWSFERSEAQTVPSSSAGPSGPSAGRSFCEAFPGFAATPLLDLMTAVARGLRVGSRELAGLSYRTDSLDLRLDCTLVRVDDERIAVVARDVTDCHRRQDEFIARTHMLDAIGEAVIVTGTNGMVTFWNRAATELYGWTRDEALGREVWSLVVPDPVVHRARLVVERVAEGRKWTGEFPLRRKDGSQFIAQLTNAPLYGRDGSVTGVIGIAIDVTRRRVALHEAGRREQILEEAQEIGGLGHYVFDIPGDRWKHSEQLDRIFGIGPDFDATAAGWLSLVHPDDRDEVGRYLAEDVIRGHRPFDREYRIVNQVTGETRWVRGRGRLEIDASGAATTMLGTIQDVTDARRRERWLEDVVRETNHRVKNNLMLVGAILSLKEQAADPPLDLSDVRGRLAAIQEIHDLLSHSDAATDVSIRDYLERVVATVASVAGSAGVDVEMDIADVRVPTRLAVSLGLVTNELVTNAAKHGGAHTRARVTVRLDADTDGYRLTVANDGPPIPESVNFDEPATLGLRLVSAIVSQYGGTLDVTRSPSPELRIMIPVHGPAEAQRGS